MKRLKNIKEKEHSAYSTKSIDRGLNSRFKKNHQAAVRV